MNDLDVIVIAIVVIGLVFFFTKAAPEQISPNDDPNSERDSKP